MLAVTSLVLVSLAAVVMGAVAAHSDPLTIGKYSEILQEKSSGHCLRTSGIDFDFFDPVYLGTFTVNNKGFVITNKNTVLSGFHDAELYNVNWDFENMFTTGQVTLNVTMTSDYEASGKFMYLPISSSGKLTLNIYDLKANVSFSFKKVPIESEDYLQIYDLKTEQEFGLLQFNLKSDGICSAIDTLINAALNANWKLLVPIGAVEGAKVLNQKLQAKINKEFRELPYDELVKYVPL